LYIDRLVKDVDDSIPGVDESFIAYEELAKKPVGDIEEDIGMLMDMDTLADLGFIKVNPW